MLSRHSSIDCGNRASLLPIAQLAHNSSFSTTVQETRFFLMLDRPARLPVDAILGIPYEGSTAATAELAQIARDCVQVAFELARQNLSERVAKQTARNHPVFIL